MRIRVAASWYPGLIFESQTAAIQGKYDVLHAVKFDKKAHWCSQTVSDVPFEILRIAMYLQRPC